MKKYLIACFLCVVLSTQVMAQEPFTIGISGAYKPFIWEEEQGQINGYTYEVLAEAFKRMGIPLQFETYPWKRVQEYVRQGRLDGFIGAVTEERLEYSENSEEIVVGDNFVGFTGAANPRLEELQQIDSFEELKQFRVLTFLGDGVAKKLITPLGIEIDDSAPDAVSVFKKLIANRGDIYVHGKLAMGVQMREAGLEDDIVILPHVYEVQEFHLFISKNSPHVTSLPQFDEALRSMREDGTYQVISDHWD